MSQGCWTSRGTATPSPTRATLWRIPTSSPKSPSHSASSVLSPLLCPDLLTPRSFPDSPAAVGPALVKHQACSGLWGTAAREQNSPPSHADMCAGWKQVLGEQSDQGGLQGWGSELRLSGGLCMGAPSRVWGRHPLPCCFLFCLTKLCSVTPGNPPVARSSEQTGEGEGKREKRAWLPGEGKESKPERGAFRKGPGCGECKQGGLSKEPVGTW